jgi:hypothetical protein
LRVSAAKDSKCRHQSPVPHGGLFPKYNPGTGTFTSEQINLFVLPSKDIFFVLVGAQKS